MGTDVADNEEGVQPGVEDSVRHAEVGGDGLFDGMGHAAVKGEDRTEGHDFDGHPDWQRGMDVRIFFLKMRDEDIAAAVRLVVDFFLEGREFGGIDAPHRIAAHAIGEGIVVRVGVVVRQLCADRDFDAFDRVHDQEAQPPVEGVPLPNLVERGAGAVGMVVGVSERKEVAGKAVVVNGGESLAHDAGIALHTALKKVLDLFVEGQRRFVVLHAPPLKIKNPPRDSMSCDRGPAGVLQSINHNSGFLTTLKMQKSTKKHKKRKTRVFGTKINVFLWSLLHMRWVDTAFMI